MYIKANEKWLSEDGMFITEVAKEPKERESQEEGHLLNYNIDKVFAHLKKLKIFTAWKSQHMKPTTSGAEFSKFSVNVAKILHNLRNITQLTHIHSLRRLCFKESVLCNFIKEENAELNEKIR